MFPPIVWSSRAQPFDRWFGRAPTLTSAAFREKVGLPADGDLVVFVGSTVSISSPDAEERWVRDWLRALRTSDEPRLRNAAVLIRPHPYNLGRWADAEFEDLGPVAVWPRHQVSIVDDENRRDDFDSLFHATAVVGINTSAMVEAAVVGRPVLSVLTSEFRDRQEGSLHFQYLRRHRGGCVIEAASLSEHVSQLAQVLAGASAAARRLRQVLCASPWARPGSDAAWRMRSSRRPLSAYRVLRGRPRRP